MILITKLDRLNVIIIMIVIVIFLAYNYGIISSQTKAFHASGMHLVLIRSIRFI